MSKIKRVNLSPDYCSIFKNCSSILTSWMFVFKRKRFPFKSFVFLSISCCKKDPPSQCIDFQSIYECFKLTIWFQSFCLLSMLALAKYDNTSSATPSWLLRYQDMSFHKEELIYILCYMKKYNTIHKYKYNW